MIQQIVQKLQLWFQAHRRELPWRHTVDPYRVWVSEVMLQQTRASVVIPYFKRWMNTFPKVEVLAEAPLEQVIKMWEGLGYYSRARNLKRGAEEVVARFQGKIPDSFKELLFIPGIGPYTAGAILSFAFHQNVPAVDGNVMRVLSRLFCLEECLRTAKSNQQIMSVIERLLKEPYGWVTTEALIELGALVCLPTPKCSECPLRGECSSFRLGKQSELPKKQERRKKIFLKRAVAIIEAEKKVLIQKQGAGNIMQDLYEFPYFPMQTPWPLHLVKEWIGADLVCQGILDEEKHVFTHHQVTLFPAWLQKEKIEEKIAGEWVPLNQLIKYPFSAGHRRVLEHFLQMRTL